MGFKEWSYTKKGALTGGLITGGLMFIYTLFSLISDIAKGDLFMNSLSEEIAFYIIFAPMGIITFAIPGLLIGALIGFIHEKMKTKTKK